MGPVHCSTKSISTLMLVATVDVAASFCLPVWLTSRRRRLLSEETLKLLVVVSVVPQFLSSTVCCCSADSLVCLSVSFLLRLMQIRFVSTIVFHFAGESRNYDPNFKGPIHNR